MPRTILENVRVLDLSQGQAGSVAALILAESGADVVKVEPPNGTTLRGKVPFNVWNRSKRSIAIDAFDSDRQTFETLVKAADVLLHDYPPAQAARHGLDEASLRLISPNIIVASISGFPLGHEEQEMPVHDTLVLAASGIMDEQAPVGRDDGPVYLRFPLASWGAAWLAAVGVTIRLLNIRRGGETGNVRTSLLQGALIPVLMHWRQVDSPSHNLGYGMPKMETNPTLVECSDGKWIHFIGDVMKAPLVAEAMGSMRPEDRDAANKADANAYWDQWGCCKAAFKTRPSEVWLQDLWSHDVAAQPVLAMGELYFDEQCRANKYVVDVEDAELGKTKQPGMPFVTDPPPRAPTSAPKLDADRSEILSAWTGMRRASPVQESFKRPLEGIRVLDLGSFLAGPLAPMLLGDLGADVIKLESLQGDAMRGAAEWSFFGCQRNKRSFALDLKSRKVRAIVERLVKQVDIVHHNQRMPAAKRLGIDYESLSAINPRLIYTHVSSYGPRGPRKDWPGYDQLFQSSSGWEYEGAGEGNPPMWHRFGMMDHQAALSSLYGTILALIERERTGRGQFVAASLLGASLLTSSETYLMPDGALQPYPRLDSMQMGIGPGDSLYRVADGWLALVADEAAVNAICSALDVSEPDEIRARLATFTLEDALTLARKSGADATQARLDQNLPFLNNPANRGMGLVASLQHPDYGKFEQPGALWSFEGQELAFDRAPPKVGQHTDEILEELGFSQAEMAEMKSEKVVLQASTPTP